MKSIFLLGLLIGFTFSQVTVTEADKCSQCSEFKSQQDCESTSKNLECEWQNSTCALKSATSTGTFKSYCEQFVDPVTKCAQIFGCAYFQGKCTHFTGCTAYSYTSLAECQAISNRCVTNGVTCDNIQLCKDYSNDVCESNPSPKSPYKCKLENNSCRDYKCVEASTSLTTDYDCNAWVQGCVTTGFGCIDILPNCSEYKGTDEICNKMIGKDGKCNGGKNGACNLRMCSDAVLLSWNNIQCNNFRSGCISTGFSCVDQLQLCSTYTGDSVTCLNYIGSDGQCAADVSSTSCRVRKCEDKISGVLSDCTTYLSGCKTNGVTCVTILGNCSSYKGTVTTCAKIVSVDGNCKGLSAIDSTVSCALKTCADDDLGTETTDADCKKVQSYCITTGKGCVSTLLSCTTYPDDGNCLKYVGVEGKCKAGNGGATPKCAVRACTDNATATTNIECQNYLAGCVTNGVGCVAETNCTDTVSKLTCTGTTNKFSCAWSESCVAKDCTSFSSNQSLCSNTQLSDTQPCIWKTNACYNAVCGDFTETEDGKCDAHMKGCVTNGNKCVDPTDCTQFQGNMTTCRAFTQAKCTNMDDTVAATTPCNAKTCDDFNINALQDSDCDAYLTGCLFSGDTTNKCASNLKDCTYFFGTSTSDCSKFTGYKSAIERETCWYTAGTKCVTKTCDLGTGMTNNTDCAGFMNGCVFDGNGSCVDVSSNCTHFRYTENASDCQNLRGVNGTQKCYDGSSNVCKNRVCTDAPKTYEYITDAQCDAFLSGCLSTGYGCIEPTATCSSYQGTSTQCGGFKGNSISCKRILYCVTPTSKKCANKIDAISNSQCIQYTSTCVLIHGTSNCTEQVSICTGYILNQQATTADKTTYCNTVLTSANLKCAYDSAITRNCVNRSCALWNNSLGVPCYSYAGPSSCLYANNVCYTPSTCESLTVPNSGIADKVAYCNKFQNSTKKKCTFDSKVLPPSLTCKTMNKCEEAILPSIQDDCYIQTGQSNCILIGTACVTIKTNCANYDIKPCTSYSFPVNINTEVQKLVFCQNMYDFGTKNYCSFTFGSLTCGTPKSCSDYSGLTATTAPASSNLNFCNIKRDKIGVICTYVDYETTCSAATGTAICTLITNGISTDSDCDLYTTPLFCKKSGSSCVAKDLCTAVTPAGGSELADCQAVTGPDGLYCSWVAPDTACKVAEDSCATITGASMPDCLSYINKHGMTCTWVTSAAMCSDPVALTCEDATSPKSQADCDLLGTGCIFYNGDCIRNAALCTSYDVSSGFATDADKQAYCNGRITTTGVSCTNDSSNNCVAVAACSSYIASGADYTAKLTFCQTILTTDNNGCTFLTSGINCLEVADSCTSYTVAVVSDCSSLQDNQGRTCSGTTTTCSYPDCSTIINPNSQNDCDTKIPGCIFYQKTCITLGACQSYSQSGVNARSYCEGLKDINGVQCLADTDTDTNCKARECSDQITSYFTTHKECQDYSPMCKSDGLGCVSITEPCTQFQGESESCSWFLDSTGQGSCQGAELATDTQQCTQTTCEMNVTAKSQSECDNFLIGGNCKWKNPGCFDQSIPCSQYRGLASECKSFIGNGIKCYGDSQSVRGQCRDKNCNDKITAIDDAECNEFLTDCIFNGVGCVHKSYNCNAFKGTNITCKNYKANNGNTLCWSTSTQIKQCTTRQCYHLQGTSDAECEAHLPNSNCITNGKTCLKGPLPCLSFIGDENTCSKFTAIDGPCKVSQISLTPVTCIPRICNEAPNTLVTNSQCQNYHPSCKTNGRGCQLTVTCDDYQTKKSCSANSSCLWTSSCRTTSNTCQSLTLQGKQMCINNPNKKCVWQSDLQNYCRDYQCSDYDATLNTHQDCMNNSNNKCTTTGAGCIDYGICSSYQSASICLSAHTTEPSLKCSWENANCRQQQCTDLNGQTEEDCNVELDGCKFNGKQCIGPNYDCSDFNGQQKFCLIDSQGQPCLYVNGICYPYDECTDIQQPSQDLCQAISPSCVAGTTTCIALNQCDKYKEKVSCYRGINGTICGWLLNQTCAEFKQCSDLAGTIWSDCQIWNSSCVSDGTNCVPIGECTSYLKQISCENNVDTKQNACFWTGAECRLMQCSDIVAYTDSECVKNKVKEGLCTTDGTKCVPRAACIAYQSQTACTVGSDGFPCIYGYPVGQTTGIQSCRSIKCTDFGGINNNLCSGRIQNKVCVSNGKNCIDQGTCQSYSNKISCSGGGTDSAYCIFISAPTVSNPDAGSCIAFNSCGSANGDKLTCTSNKSCKYSDSTNLCQTIDCSTFNQSAKCEPIPSFDGKSFTICIPSLSGCVAGNATSLSQTDCYSTVSLYAFTWNSSTNKCSRCKVNQVINNSTQTNTSTNTSTNPTNSYSQYILFQMAILMVVFMI